MQIGRWQFNPGIWPTIATLILLPVLLALGFWQLDRYDQKLLLERQYQQKTSAAPLDLNLAADEIRMDREAMIGRRCLIRGSFVRGILFLLDNQVMQGKAGYFVYIPVRLAGENKVVLVNYGWTSTQNDRNKTPQLNIPEAEIRLQGVAKYEPASGIILNGVTTEEKMSAGTYRLQHLDIKALPGNNNWQLLPYIVRLDSPAPEDVIRDWPAPEFGKEKNLGYAFQWFAFALVLVFIYLIVNLKSTETS